VTGTAGRISRPPPLRLRAGRPANAAAGAIPASALRLLLKQTRAPGAALGAPLLRRVLILAGDAAVAEQSTRGRLRGLVHLAIRPVFGLDPRRASARKMIDPESSQLITDRQRRHCALVRHPWDASDVPQADINCGRANDRLGWFGGGRLWIGTRAYRTLASC
jgi:hypothetical protein